MYKDVCFKKENGVTSEIVRNNLTDHTCAFTEKENCFSDIINPKEYDKMMKLYVGVSKYIARVVANDPELGVKFMNKLNDLENAKINDLRDIAGLILMEALEINKDETHALSREYETLEYKESVRTGDKIFEIDDYLYNDATKATVTSMIIKQYIYNFYYRVIKDLEHEDFMAVLYAKEKGNDDLMLKLLKIDYINDAFRDYAISVLKEAVDKRNETVGVHLCWEHCKNANPLSCLKVAHRVKQPIDTYDFIKSGYQAYDSKGQLEYLTVTECDNYVKNDKTAPTAKDRAELRELRQNLMLLAYGAETIEEAKKNKGNGFSSNIF